MQVNTKLVSALNKYSNSCQEVNCLLRLVDGELVFINLQNQSLTLFEQIQKFFGIGGFNLKEIWKFINQNLEEMPELRRVVNLDQLNAASVRFDAKAEKAFAWWRKTKEIREIALAKLQTIAPTTSNPINTSSYQRQDESTASQNKDQVEGQELVHHLPQTSSHVDVPSKPILHEKSNNKDTPLSEEEELQALKTIYSNIPYPQELHSIREQEESLLHGIQVLKELLHTNRSHLCRKAFEESIKIEFEIISKVDQLNKSIKKQNPKSIAAAEYDKFTQEIPALKEIRNLKNSLKNADELVIRMLFNKFDRRLLGNSPRELSLLYTQRNKATNEKMSPWKKQWLETKRNIFLSAQEWRPIESDGKLASKRITWLTGSSTASLIPIFRKATESGPALIPTGELLKHHIAPLTGELHMGLQGVNRSQLSGVTLENHAGALDYAQSAKNTFMYTKERELQRANNILDEIIKDNSVPIYNLVRLQIALIRLKWAGLAEDEIEDLTKKLNRAKEIYVSNQYSKQWERYAALIGVKPAEKPESTDIAQNKEPLPGMMALIHDSDSQYSIGMVYRISEAEYGVVCDTNQGYVQWINKDRLILVTDEYLSKIALPQNQTTVSLNKFVDELKPQLKEKREYIEEATNLFQTTYKLELSEKERRFIESPAPIVWGSLTKTQDQLHHVRSDIRGEKAVIGAQRLGEDIQILFTDPERIDEVKAYVQEHLPATKKIHVLSSKVIPFLHAHQLNHNEYTSYYA